MFLASLLRSVHHLGTDRRGSLAPTFALLSVPMVLMVGMGVDYGNGVRAVSKLQSAADSAVLAAARLSDPDAGRADTALRYFRAHLDSNLASMVKTSQFTLAQDGNTVTGLITAQIPTSVSQVMGATMMSKTITSTAAIAKPDIRQLDLVFCIDATGSMSNTLNAVKTNALNLEANLNDELVRRGIAKFDAMRVRAIYYRDYGGNYMNGTSSYTVSYWNGTKYASKTSKPSDPDYWTYVGDVPPMKTSSFFNLPGSRTDFQSYVNPETANGGGDLPESGLECVNEAMDSPWAKAVSYTHLTLPTIA